jgi:hypothetical protein
LPASGQDSDRSYFCVLLVSILSLCLLIFRLDCATVLTVCVVSLHFSPYEELPSTRQLVFETRNDSIFPPFQTYRSDYLCNIIKTFDVSTISYITIPHSLSPFHMRYHHSICAITIPHALSPFHMRYHHLTCPIIIPHALSPFHMRN